LCLSVLLTCFSFAVCCLFEQIYDDDDDEISDVLWLLCLGNKYIYQMTKIRHQVLHVEMVDWNGNQRHTTYDHFIVSSETEKFKLVRLVSDNETTGR